MKLFLSSKSVAGKLGEHLIEFVGKPASEIRFCLIENAADPYAEEKKGFMYETRDDLKAAGITYDPVDLNTFRNADAIKEKLQSYDVVWVGGGNTYYLRWLMKKTGFDTVIKEVVQSGVVYGGGSAGAIVAGQTLKGFEPLDDPEKAPELILEGLHLTNIAVIPHWGMEKYTDRLVGVKRYFEELGLKHVSITNTQAVEVSDGEWKIVE